MKLKQVIEQITKQERHLDDLANIQSLSKCFDSVLIGFSDSIREGIYSLIDEITKKLKGIQNKSNYEQIELDIVLSLLTYLILYKSSIIEGHSNINFIELSKLVSLFITSSKFKNLPTKSYEIIANCLTTLLRYSLHDVNTFVKVYEVLYSVINLSDIISQEKFLDVFTDISYLPLLLKTMENKKNLHSVVLMKLVTSLIFKFIIQKQQFVTFISNVSPNDIKIFVSFWSSINNQKDQVYYEACILLLFAFIPNGFSMLTIEDYFFILNHIHLKFCDIVSDSHVNNLVSFLLTITPSTTIKAENCQSFIELLLIVYYKKPSQFIEIFNRLNSIEEFEWCILDLMVEMTRREFIIKNIGESQPADTIDNEIQNNDNSERNCSQMEDLELEDLSNYKDNKVYELLAETASNIFFANKSVSTQQKVFEAICNSPDFLDSIISKLIKLLATSKLEDEDAKEIEPSSIKVIDFITNRLRNLVKESIRESFKIPSMLPEIVSLLIKRGAMDQADDSPLNDQASDYEFLKFMSLISLTERDTCTDVLKSIGYETGNLEEALHSFALSIDSFSWKDEINELIFNCFEHNVSETKDNQSLKSSFIGCIVFSPIRKLERFVSLMTSISDFEVIQQISESLSYINVSNLSSLTSQTIHKIIEIIGTHEIITRQENIISLLTSLLNNKNWNKERIVESDIYESIKRIIDIIPNDENVISVCIQILAKILNADKNLRIDALLKEKIINLFMTYKEISKKYAKDIVSAISIAYQDHKTQSESSISRYEEMERLALVPNLFSFIDDFIEEEANTSKVSIDAISAICSFYSPAFDLAFEKLKSNSKLIVDSYIKGIVKYLEKTDSLVLKEQFSILDFLMMEQKIIVGGIGGIKNLEVYCEMINSPEVAKSIIEKLTHVQVNIIERNANGELNENTFMRLSRYTDQLLSHYIRVASSYWIDNLVGQNTDLNKKIIEASEAENVSKEQLLDLCRLFFDTLNELPDNIPSTPLKVAYYMSTLVDSLYMKRLIFQSLIIFHFISYKMKNLQSQNIIDFFSNFIMKANTPLRCDSFVVQEKLRNKKNPKGLMLSDDEYDNIVGTLVQISGAMYKKAKELYEAEGLGNMWYNKYAPTLRTDAAFANLCSIASKLVDKTDVGEESEAAVDEFLYKLFQFSIEYNHDFPEEWNNKEKLMKIYQLSAFYKQSKPGSEIKTSMADKNFFRNIDEKKWYIISYILIVMSNHNSKNNDIYIQLLVQIIKRLGINCSYQIPALAEAISGRIDSLALQISEGLAECNGNLASTFLREYFGAFKETNRKYMLTSMIILLPWSAAAGKQKNDQYLTEIIESFLNLNQHLSDQFDLPKLGSILMENLVSYSKGVGKPVEELLINELAKACKLCLAEDESKVNWISKILFMNLNSCKMEFKQHLALLVHSCIVGTAIYDSPSLRSLLRSVLFNGFGFAKEIDFLEDKDTDGYDCIVQIAALFSERKDLLSEFTEFFKKIFVDDALISPINKISIVGWMFLSVFIRFEDISIPDKNDESYFKYFMEKSSENEYGEEDIRHIVQNCTRAYTPIHKLVKFSISNPKEFCDIISIYILNIYNIKHMKAGLKELDINSDIDDFNSGILIGFASINGVRYTQFEDKIMMELFDGDFNEDIWNSKALPFFIYLAASHSNNLERFINISLNKGLLIGLISNLSHGLTILDPIITESSLDSIISQLSEVNMLEFVVSNIIQFAADDDSFFNKQSIELLTKIFRNSSLCVAKKTLPSVLWKFYSAIEKLDNTKNLQKPIETILDWTINVTPTVCFYESLTILQEIVDKMKIGTLEKLAKQLDVYRSFDNKIDYEMILQYISEASLDEITGAVFVFGKGKEASEDQKEVYNESLMKVLQLYDCKTPSVFQLDVVSNLVKAGNLLETEAKYVIDHLCDWIDDDETLPLLGNLINNLLDSIYFNNELCTRLLPKLLTHIISFIKNRKDTVNNAIKTIQEDASKIKENILETNENSNIDSLITSIINGIDVIDNTKELVKLLSNTNGKAQKGVNEIVGEINECVGQYYRFNKLAVSIEGLFETIPSIIRHIEIKKPETLHEEQSLRELIAKIMELMKITEIELNGFNSLHTLHILQSIAEANPEVIIPLIYASFGKIPMNMLESISIVLCQFITSSFNPSVPVLVQILEENNFEKLFDNSFDIGELIDIISYLSITQSFDNVFKAADEKLAQEPNFTENSTIAKVFIALFCFLIRPLYFGPRITQALNDRNVNDCLYQITFPENFYYYFNKLTVGNDVKKNLFVECIFKPVFKYPNIYQTKADLCDVPFDSLDFRNIKCLDEFMETISDKNVLCASFGYQKAANSRENVIKILQKKGFVDSEYELKEEKEQQKVDFRICSELPIFARIDKDPYSCAYLYQKNSEITEPDIVYFNMPSIRYFLEYDRCTLWTFVNLIRNEKEAMKIVYSLTSLYSDVKKVRELISFIAMRYPKETAEVLIKYTMNSAFMVNIRSIPVLQKKGEIRYKSTMRFIKLLYQLALLFPGLFNEYGPSLVANCICSMNISFFKHVKYVKGLITQYVAHISSDVDQTILDKNEELMKALDSKERHFGTIAQLAFELFGAIGEEKQNEFVSLFNTISIFNFSYLYPMAVSAHIKLYELGAIQNDSLKRENAIDQLIKNIIRNFYCYLKNEDGSWSSYVSAIYETIENLVSLKCSAKETKLMAYFSVIAIMSVQKDIRLAAISLLHTCISNLAAENEINDDELLASCVTHFCVIEANEKIHKMLTKESQRNFISLFAVCVSVSLGYGDKETTEAINNLLKDAWSAWSQRVIASLYVLLPMVGYSTLDVKEVTGMDFIPLLRSMINSLPKVDQAFIQSYIRSAARDSRCPRERFNILCPNGVYPMEKDKKVDLRKETVRVYIPPPEKCFYFFSLIIDAFVNASSV